MTKKFRIFPTARTIHEYENGTTRIRITTEFKRYEMLISSNKQEGRMIFFADNQKRFPITVQR
jgi:hypothetical protein